MYPRSKPKNCCNDTVTRIHSQAMIMVLNAVVAFNIARMFESETKLAYENSVKGIALFIIDKTKTCFQMGFKR